MIFRKRSQEALDLEDIERRRKAGTTDTPPSVVFDQEPFEPFLNETPRNRFPLINVLFWISFIGIVIFINMSYFNMLNVQEWEDLSVAQRSEITLTRLGVSSERLILKPYKEAPLPICNENYNPTEEVILFKNSDGTEQLVGYYDKYEEKIVYLYEKDGLILKSVIESGENNYTKRLEEGYQAQVQQFKKKFPEFKVEKRYDSGDFEGYEIMTISSSMCYYFSLYGKEKMRTLNVYIYADKIVIEETPHKMGSSNKKESTFEEMEALLHRVFQKL